MQFMTLPILSISSNNRKCSTFEGPRLEVKLTIPEIGVSSGLQINENIRSKVRGQTHYPEIGVIRSSNK